MTKSGNSCLPWSTSTQKNETWATSTALTDNFCRNPNGKEYGPWCYINGNNSWEYCEIPRCPGKYIPWILEDGEILQKS